MLRRLIKLLEEQGVVRRKRRRRRGEVVAPPAPADIDFYAVVKDLRRGERQDRASRQALEGGAKSTGVSLQAARSGEVKRQPLN